MALDGPLWVRAWHGGGVHVFELEAEDVCYLPAGAPHEYRNAGRRDRARDLRDRAELPAVTVALGLDVGGTKIAAARVDTATRRDPRGRAGVADRRRRAARRRCSPTAARWRPSCGEGAERTGLARVRAGRPARAGCAAPRPSTGAATDLLADFDRVESDVRAAALAEARFGAGRAEPDFLYVSVGTGISHCLMSDGRPRRRRARQRDRHRRAARRAVVERARARPPDRPRDRGGRARRPRRGGRGRPTAPSGSASCSPRWSTRSTRAPW